MGYSQEEFFDDFVKGKKSTEELVHSLEGLQDLRTEQRAWGFLYDLAVAVAGDPLRAAKMFVGEVAERLEYEVSFTLLHAFDKDTTIGYLPSEFSLTKRGSEV